MILRIEAPLPFSNRGRFHRTRPMEPLGRPQERACRLKGTASRAPELNSQENIWQFMRQNWLSNRIFKSFDDIVDHCCYAWNTLIDQPWKIMSDRPPRLGHRRSLDCEGWY